jgi:two-component system nitrogen regulation sensor histidine kinase NtrY
LTEADDRVLREGTDSIVREVGAMRHLVDEFSQFARLPALKPVPGDINKAVSEAVALFRVVGEQAEDGEVEVVLADNLPQVSFDDEQIRRVIINLLDNAIRAVKDRGEDGLVRVATRLVDETMIAVSVTDNGPGIPMNLVDRIFDPYFSTREDGTGLGLAIAQRIVEEHGGKLDCSPGHGAGTVFTIWIPVDIDPMRRI